MTRFDLIVALQLHGATQAAAGDQLLIDGSEGEIVDDPDIMWHVTRRKAEIVAFLAGDWRAALRALVEREVPDRIDDLIEQFDERAGIYEYDAHLDRQRAEELAYSEIAETNHCAGCRD